MDVPEDEDDEERKHGEKGTGPEDEEDEEEDDPRDRLDVHKVTRRLVGWLVGWLCLVGCGWLSLLCGGCCF